MTESQHSHAPIEATNEPEIGARLERLEGGWHIRVFGESGEEGMYANAVDACAYLRESVMLSPNEVDVVLTREIAPVSAMRCNLCDFETDSKVDLVDHEDTWTRLSAGEVFPAGQCPVCDGTVQASDQQVMDSGNDHWYVRVLRAKGWTLTAPTA
jgi:hypothetical protein